MKEQFNIILYYKQNTSNYALTRYNFCPFYAVDNYNIQGKELKLGVWGVWGVWVHTHLSS